MCKPSHYVLLDEEELQKIVDAIEAKHGDDDELANDLKMVLKGVL